MIEERFAFLFGNGGYTMVAHLAYEGDLYLAEIAADAECQVKFTLEKGFFALYLGSVRAQREWADGEGRDGWQSLVSLSAFEDSLHPGQAIRPKPMPVDPSLADTLDFYSTFLQGYLPRLAAIFSANLDERWAAYDRFLDTDD